MRDWGVRLYRDDGDIRLDLAPGDGAWDPADLLSARAPAVAFNWVPLSLDDTSAKELQRELYELLGRYGGRPGAPTHLLGLFLTPATFG